MSGKLFAQIVLLIIIASIVMSATKIAMKYTCMKYVCPSGKMALSAK